MSVFWVLQLHSSGMEYRNIRPPSHPAHQNKQPEEKLLHHTTTPHQPPGLGRQTPTTIPRTTTYTTTLCTTAYNATKPPNTSTPCTGSASTKTPCGSLLSRCKRTTPTNRPKDRAIHPQRTRYSPTCSPPSATPLNTTRPKDQHGPTSTHNIQWRKNGTNLSTTGHKPYVHKHSRT